MRDIAVCGLLFILLSFRSFAQVDTTYIYNSNTPYGSLDIRIAKSSTQYYYLQEGKTFSFRENSPGVKTDTYEDMTTWDSSPYLQGNLREKSASSDLYVMNYRLLLPQNYNASHAKGYPMIVVFHGLGESGNCWKNICHHADQNYSPITNDPPAPTNSDSELLNNDHQLANGGKVHLKARNDAGSKLPDDPTLIARAFPGFILFPQNLNGWDGSSVEDAIRLVRLITKKYNIDDNRVYIHGLSNGGHGVYDAIKRAPWLFAAALPMSAIDDGFINNQKVAPTIAHIPLWLFQGALDINPYPQKTENYIKQFRDAGAVVRYTKYSNLGHGTWSTAYNEPDFFSWILGKNKANIHVFAGNSTICQSAGVKLELGPGFKAYQWERNGQVISGAITSSYMATTAGTYKARFSRVDNPAESQWNKWSDPVTVTVGQGLPQALIKQHGTVLLKDLNNFTDARLEASGTFGHYYWYKDGTLIDFPGDQDDTIKYATLKPIMGKGVYTLVVSNFDNCKSPSSTGKYVFFNNAAPINITAPTNFAGQINSASEITLTWTDASSNENGFEIWRRRKTDEASFTAWEMPTITNGNVSSYKDFGLYPSTTYQYKIRGVSNTGRSLYTPSSDSEFLVLTTGADTQPPTAPEKLIAYPTGVKTVKLTWERSTDNTGIKEYIVYSGPDTVAAKTTDTTLVLTNLKLNTVFTFKVKAVDLAGNKSAFSNEQKPNTYISGLYYEHSTGAWRDLDSINWLQPEFTGILQTFTLAPKTQADYFNFRFDGYLFITKQGTYQFRTSSDDGSRLKINNIIIVDNDGAHNFQTITSSNRSLTAGAHRITVDFFEYNESDSLRVEYKGPDSNEGWMMIPLSALKSSEHIVTGMDPDNGPEDSFIVSVYPNPSTQDNINIKIQSVNRAPFHIQLVDISGRRLFNSMVDPNETTEVLKLSPSEALTPGLYIVMVQQAKTIIRKKLIVR